MSGDGYGFVQLVAGDAHLGDTRADVVNSYHVMAEGNVLGGRLILDLMAPAVL